MTSKTRLFKNGMHVFAQDEDIFRSAHAQNGNSYSLSSLVSQHTDNSELRHA